jgi:hypothetical protein
MVLSIYTAPEGRYVTLKLQETLLPSFCNVKKCRQAALGVSSKYYSGL